MTSRISSSLLVALALASLATEACEPASSDGPSGSVSSGPDAPRPGAAGKRTSLANSAATHETDRDPNPYPDRDPDRRYNANPDRNAACYPNVYTGSSL